MALCSSLCSVPHITLFLEKDLIIFPSFEKDTSPEIGHSNFPNFPSICKFSELKIIDLITQKLKAIASTSDVRRLISQNAIKIDTKPIADINYDCSKHSKFLLQIGKKKAYKISIK